MVCIKIDNYIKKVMTTLFFETIRLTLVLNSLLYKYNIHVYIQVSTVEYI